MEIESLAQLDRWLAARRPLAGTRLQNLDLDARAIELLGVDPGGSVVLGGRLSGQLEEHFRRGGAVIFPPVHDAPVEVYRSMLYTPAELFAGLDRGYEHTPDGRSYAWTRDASLARDSYATVLRALHDDAIADALAEVIDGHRCVGVMGGHALARGSLGYASAARLGRALAEAGFVVLTGGGPGAMEAAMLGAYSVASSPAALDAALNRLAAVPEFTDVAAWARLGLAVRADLAAPKMLACVGIPTWFYGHEPPSPFAQWQAKFFSNAIREDVLLTHAGSGLVYLPGQAGTVQEIFQAVTPGYYSPTGGVPLVFVDETQWTQRVPVWATLQALAQGRALQSRLHLVPADDPSAVLAALAS